MVRAIRSSAQEGRPINIVCGQAPPRRRSHPSCHYPLDIRKSVECRSSLSRPPTVTSNNCDPQTASLPFMEWVDADIAVVESTSAGFFCESKQRKEQVVEA